MRVDAIRNQPKSDGRTRPDQGGGVRWLDYVSAGAPVTREYNVNRRGADYRNFDLASEDPQACAQACAEDAKCQAYTYAPAGHWEGSPPQCWLKDSVPPRTEVADLVSGVRLE
ncbi:PAN domain-containing protein [Halochromatium glycolicum]|uniref:Apple domain-containing protein n=1 Tax=Halochromatium glycolicum TaxID=85075 RepID=A0AAJ0XBT3_9GAMM|nr:hypothetical protein [Halochromatium glycolicum]